MDLLPEIVLAILDYVGDTRRYACVSRLAWKHCRARPDHTVWRRVRSLNDHFVHGNKSTITWALANIPALVALDDIGLTCALANAVRADNPAATKILLERGVAAAAVAKFCGPATKVFFNTANIRSWRYCQCPAELGVMFKNIKLSDISNIIENKRLSDEYLERMLSPDDGELILVAARNNRIVLARKIISLCAVGRADIVVAVQVAHDEGHLQFVLSLASEHGIEVENLIAKTICNAIANGKTEEFEPGTAEYRAAARMLSASLGLADGRILVNAGPKLNSLIANHCSDETISALVKRRGGEIAFDCAKIGRTKFIDKKWLPRPVTHKSTMLWFAENNIKIDRRHTTDMTIDLYLAVPSDVFL